MRSSAGYDGASVSYIRNGTNEVMATANAPGEATGLPGGWYYANVSLVTNSNVRCWAMSVTPVCIQMFVCLYVYVCVCACVC